MKKMVSFFLSFLLWLSPVTVFGASALLDELKDLTVQERESLKNIEISDELRKSLENPLTGIKPKITENDRKALRLLGYNDKEIDDLSLDSFINKDGKEKFRSHLNHYADSKNNEVNREVNSNLVPGLGSAVIGLAFASLLGIVVGVRCTNQPSALTFAATSAAWVGLEMMIWKGYQIRMDDINTLASATRLPKEIEKRIGHVKRIIKRLEGKYKENPTGNFEAFLEENSADVDKLKAAKDEFLSFLKKAKDKQFGSIRSIQESLALAAETSRKKARNAGVAAIGFSGAAALAALEGLNIFNSGGACVSAMQKQGSFWDILIPRAHAKFASVGDLDKIGIPLGAGLAAAYLGFKKKFADKIFSSPTGRALTFTAMAALAAFTAMRLKEAAKFLDKQAHEMDIFATAAEEKFKNAGIIFSDKSALIDELKKELIPQLEDIARSASTSVKEKLSSQAKESLSKELLKELPTKLPKSFEGREFEEQIKKSSLDNLPLLDNKDFQEKIKMRTSLWDHLIPPVFAAYENASPVSCFKRGRTFLFEDSDCHCRKNKSCAQTPFLKNLQIKSTPAGLKSFIGMAVTAGRTTTKASNMIMAGAPSSGLNHFQKMSSMRSKLLLGGQKLLSQKMGEAVDFAIVSKVVRGALESTRPAWQDYYSGQRKGGPTYSVLIRAQRAKDSYRGKFPLDDIALLKASIRRKLLAVKELGNSSLKQLQAKKTRNEGALDGSYDYSKEAIIKDPHKDIFEIIKKRYLIIQSQGRFSN